MKIKFEFQGETHLVEAETIQGQTWLHFGGKTWAQDSDTKSRQRRAGQKQGSQDQITAPMPGKIIKVAITGGEMTEAGQVVIIMEAMKMEYTLKTDRPVKIDSVLVKSGQQVRLGETLVSFVKEGAKS